MLESLFSRRRFLSNRYRAYVSVFLFAIPFSAYSENHGQSGGYIEKPTGILSTNFRYPIDIALGGFSGRYYQSGFSWLSFNRITDVNFLFAVNTDGRLCFGGGASLVLGLNEEMFSRIVLSQNLYSSLESVNWQYDTRKPLVNDIVLAFFTSQAIGYHLSDWVIVWIEPKYRIFSVGDRAKNDNQAGKFGIRYRMSVSLKFSVPITLKESLSI